MTNEEIIHRHNILTKLCNSKSFPFSVLCSHLYMMNDKNSKYYYDKLIPSRNPERYSSENDYLTISSANKYWNLISI